MSDENEFDRDEYLAMCERSAEEALRREFEQRCYDAERDDEFPAASS